jgi:hypothetical protein
MNLLVVLWSTATLVVTLAQDDTCTIDGEIYQRGENLGSASETRCGSAEEYPCFCNPDLTDLNQVECPYCGFVAGDGSFYCAKDQETISFPDGSIVRVCSCEIQEDPSQEPIRSCTSQTLPPETSGCELFDFDGNAVTFEDGESFGDLIEGACGPSTEWPSFCSVPPDAGNGEFEIEYPYCVFDDTESKELECARNNTEITYTDTNGDEVTCTCVYSDEGGAQPECERPPTQAPTPAPVKQPTPLAPQPTELEVSDTEAPTLEPSIENESSASLASLGLVIVGSILVAYSFF